MVYLSVLLLVTLVLTGCSGGGNQSVESFLKEFDKANNSLNAKKVVDMIYFPNTEEGKAAKSLYSESTEIMFKSLRLAKAKVTQEIRATLTSQLDSS